MSQTIIVIDNRRSCLHLLQHSWMLLLLLNLRLSSEVHRSAESSAVGLVALHCEQCSSFVNNSSAFIVYRFLMPPSTEAGQTLLLVYIHS